MSVSLTAELYCDSCKQVLASVGPDPRSHTMTLISEAMRKAQARGAHIGIDRVICADCWKNAKIEAAPTCAHNHP